MQFDIIGFIFCRYHCGYALQHHREEPNHGSKHITKNQKRCQMLNIINQNQTFF